MISEERNNTLEIKIYEKALKKVKSADIENKYLHKLKELYEFQNSFIKNNSCNVVCLIYKSNFPPFNKDVNYWHSNYKRPIVQMDLKGSVVDSFESISVASAITGIHKTCISDVANNRNRNKAGGYKWKFKH